MEINYTTKLKQQEHIFLLYENLGWNAFLKLDQAQIINAMAQSWHVVYAYDDDELIGTGRVISDGITNAYLCGLGVTATHRNKGIGTEITRRLVEHCMGHNLHIQFFCAEKLVPYYNKMGFDVFAVGMRKSNG